MSNYTEFLTYLQEQVGQPYVWGGQHLRLRPSDYVSIIQRKEDGVHEDAAIAFCREKFEAGATVLYAYDCSGLGMYFLQNLKKIYSKDKNANGMMGTCTIVDKPKKGCWVFRLSGGRATHIGYMVSDTDVIHAKGRAYGVVREPYKKSYWHRIGVPECFADEINGDDPEPIKEYVFTRILKYGCRGRDNNNDVQELKKALLAKGFSGLDITNGNFLKSTRSTVIRFQKSAFPIKAKEWDGIVGAKTYARLGVEFAL